MRKLTLDLEAIQVDSFETDASPTIRGTVLANREKTISPDCPVIGHDTHGFTACQNHTCLKSCEWQLGGCSFESCGGTCPMGGCHPTAYLKCTVAPDTTFTPPN